MCWRPQQAGAPQWEGGPLPSRGHSMGNHGPMGSLPAMAPGGPGTQASGTLMPLPAPAGQPWAAHFSTLFLDPTNHPWLL